MASARAVLPLLVLSALVTGLAGCFKSETPLIDAAQAKFPFQSIVLKADDEETEIIRREGALYRRIEDDQPRGEPLLIYEIAANLYLIQETGASGDATYVFAKRDADKLIVQSDCGGIDTETLKRLHIDYAETSQSLFFECNAKDLGALIALGQSANIWSGTAQTFDIVSIE